ncbi:OsmC family protein [Peribacillus sp. SCS-155]|uniref:OsmC family protein n=1 Tax=Peribacillus sedimenti TaxID=3115297 RepID=UPI0039059E32
MPTSPDKLTANVEGIIEAPEGVLKITRINVHYNIQVPKGLVPAAERALSVFERGCPVAQTLKGAIAFTHTSTILETEDA